MGLTGKTTEEKIWRYLTGAGLSTHGAAALMGNLNAESALNPKNLQNTYERSLGYTDETYTAAVDSGKYTNFVNDAAGYGLAQWTYYTRKRNLLEYAKAVGKSIGDLETQLGFLIKELSSDYKSLFEKLKKAQNVREASDAVLTIYERPADQSEAVKVQRAKYGEVYLSKYWNVAASDKPPSDKPGTNNTGSATKPAQPVKATAFKIGDVVKFTGGPHYENANAKNSNGTPTAGSAKVTAISEGAKHPYHIVHTDKKSTVYGWVDADKLKKITEIKVGDVVKFTGGPHYENANAKNSNGTPAAGSAKVTAISEGAKHPYHIVHTDKKSTVYGWVDADLVVRQ